MPKTVTIAPSASKESLEKMLRDASATGDLETVAGLVSSQVNLNAACPETGYTALHFAALHNHTHTLQLLVNHGANVNAHANHNMTPLHVACLKGHNQCVEILASHGHAKLDAKDDTGCTPAHKAASHGWSYSLKELFNKQAKLDIPDQRGWTTVHCAAFHGHLNCLQVLHKWGIKMSMPDTRGYTPMHLAAAEGHLSSVKFILTSIDRVALYVRTKQGESPEELAKRLKKKAAAAYLEQVRNELENPHETIDEDLLPLHAAAAKGDINALRSLVKRGYEINTQDEKGRTALHRAAGNGHISCIRYLLFKKADFHIKTFGSETPKDVALRYGHVACAEMINLEEQNPEGVDARFEVGTSRRMKSGSALSFDKDLEAKKGDVGDEEDEELAAAKSTAESMEAKKARLFDECIRIQFELQQAKNAYASVGGLLEEDQEAKRAKELLQQTIDELREELDKERHRRETLEKIVDESKKQILVLTMNCDQLKAQAIATTTPKSNLKQPID